MTQTTPLTFTWHIQYSDDQGETWHPEAGADASGTVEHDDSQVETANIFQVACTQADIYAAAHRAEHPNRKWQAAVTDSNGNTLGVGAHG